MRRGRRGTGGGGSSGAVRLARRKILRLLLAGGGRVRYERERVLVVDDDAERAHVEFEVRLDVLEQDVPREAHDRAGRVQLEQLVRAQAVPRERAVVFEQLARREREHRVMVRGENGGELLRWRPWNTGGGAGVL